MSKQLRMKCKRAIAGIIMITTIVWLSGVMELVPVAKAATIVDGDVIRNPSAAGMAQFDVYIVKLVGTKKYKRLVLNPQVFDSYRHLKWSNVKLVTTAEMNSYTTSGLVRVDGDAAQKVYALAPSGDTGAKSWVNVTSDQFVTQAGADPDSVYTINSTDAGNYTAVADITTVNDVKTFLSAGTLPSATPVAAGQFTVSLASDNPAAANIIAESTSNEYSQSLIPFAKVNFAASSSADVKVTTVKFTRIGIGSDSDLGNLYLYDGSTKVADYNSLSSKVATFSNSAGLFTVTKGTTKSLTLKGDLARTSTSGGLGAGRTEGFTINAAADVTTDGATVSGTFPITGNLMTTASVSDLGHLYFQGASGANGSIPSTVKADEANKQLWSVNATADSQNMQIQYLKFTMVGTIATTDIKNIRLEVAGVQVGTGTTIAANNTVVFDLSANPIALTSGVTKSIALRGDMAGGSGRVFKFTIQKSADVSLYDTNYGVYVTPNVNNTTTAFGIVQQTTGNGTSVEAGTITLGVASDSPTGNIANTATAVTFAKFSFTASGEAVKVDSLSVTANESTGGQDAVMKNVKLLLDGSQIGTTATSLTANNSATADYTFGNSFIIPAGSTRYLTVVADTTGANITAGTSQISVSLVTGSGNAVGQTTLTSLSTTSQTGRTLTVQTGTPGVAVNTAVADKNAANPTGTANANNAKIASFVITAGSGEAIDVSQIVLADDAATAVYPLGRNFQNLKIKNGTTQIGTTIGSLGTTVGTATTYTFTPASNIRIGAGQSYVVDVYADVKSSPTDSATSLSPVARFYSLSATGVSTGGSANYSTAQNLQIAYVTANGSLTVTANAATPVAGQLVTGDTDVTLAILDVAAGSAEDINVSRIKLTDTSSFGGSLSNIKLYDGTTLLGTAASLSGASNGTAEFVLASNWTIPANITKQLTVKGSVNAWPNITSGGAHTVSLASAANIDSIGASSGQSITETVTSATGTEQDVYRTKVVVDRAGTSPSGTQTPGANANVLEFNVAANSSYDAVLNAVAITMSGSANLTSNGNANLYKNTDLVNAVSTRAYVTDDSTATAASTNATYVATTATKINGIPVGANIRIYDTSLTAYMATVTVTKVDNTTGTVTFTPVVTNAVAAGDILYYRPLQPGASGKVYFGAQTTLAANVVTGATTISVTSAKGFSAGDTVTVKGFDGTGTGTERTSTAGGLISAVDSTATPNTLTVSAVTLAATIVYNQLSGTAANAIANNHNSVGVAYTNAIGETISAGATKTYVVKGDTTGATTNNTLRADIAAVGDLNWKDKTHYGVTTLTKNLPITGGTLSY